MARNAEFTDEKDIERGFQRARDFERHRHAATRQRKNDDMMAAGERGQPTGELPARVGTVMKAHGRTPLSVASGFSRTKATSMPESISYCVGPTFIYRGGDPTPAAVARRIRASQRLKAVTRRRPRAAALGRIQNITSRSSEPNAAGTLSTSKS